MAVTIFHQGMRMFPRIVKRVLPGLLLVASVAAPRGAHAEEIKPYVMLLFDTSGSMSWDICRDWVTLRGDNSNECTGDDVTVAQCGTSSSSGDGIRNDTRMFKVKAGAYAVISAFGEVTFGLSRFHMAPRNFQCNRTSNSEGGGGWNGDCNGADILVGFSTNNQTDVLEWMDNCDNYGGCPYNRRPGTGGHPNTPSTGCSLCTDCGGGCDKELRADGGTPLGASLEELRTGFFPSVLAADTKASCRPYKVIVLTDGIESCGGNPNTAASRLHNGIGLANNKNIDVHVIGFGSAGLQANLNAIASNGGTGSAVIVDDEISLSLAMANIISESILRETCNNADDDCDGQCDEAWPEVGTTGANGCPVRAAQSCTVGVGVCQRTGIYQCLADGSGSRCSVTAGPPTSPVEICGNGLDDDCNGLVDDGCGSCTAQPDVCDGKDNDCDTVIDEDFVSSPCGSSIGSCRPGTTICTDGQVSCGGAGYVGPDAETCNNTDDNCDTIVDNFTRACYASPTGTAYTSGCNLGSGICLGICRLGTELCTTGSWRGCQNAVGPIAEICNGVDDDCDGTIDDGVSNTCRNYSDCSTFSTCADCPQAPAEVCDLKDNDCDGTVDNIPPLPCGIDVGECTKGTTACDAAGKEICSGGKGPSAEVCDGKDNNCNGAVDESPNDPQIGQTCGTNVGECTTGTWQCTGGRLQCVGGTRTQTEICDGKDNDCNGTVDDIASTDCGTDVGECTFGKTACRNGKQECDGGTKPAPELCDGKDNNCNGLTDDDPVDQGQPCGESRGECVPGLTQCSSGPLPDQATLLCIGGKGSSSEICDGKDNDCDGQVDNNVVGAGAECGIDVGLCEKGKMACKDLAGIGWTLVCDGEVGPTPEICDGKDNNCDGSTDESYPEQGQSCSQNVGECKAGKYVCDTGNLRCDGGTTGTNEVCNGLDDDCNGAIDDNVPGEGGDCGTDVGECEKGSERCINGKMQCFGGKQAGTEICDGKDNDCDGIPDNQAVCPGSSKCVEGQCLLPCIQGEFACPGGSVCINDYCIPDECAKANCSATQYCIEGTCIEKCKDRDCESFQICEPKTGNCVDNSCVSKGCPDGQRCIAYECKDDPCPPGKCAADKMCVDGQCIEPCINVRCPGSQVCAAGKCVDNPCQGFPCDENFVCEVDGGQAKCVPDPCRALTCPAGQVCHSGACKADPCAKASCPTYLECKLTHDGQADCVPGAGKEVPTTNGLLATGGGGFACSLNGAGSGHSDWPSATWLLLSLAALFHRRRRNRRSLNR